MPDKEQTQLRLEIAHVLFIDIVGYSKLRITQQSEVLRELNKVVSATNQFREADAEGKLIRLPTGDGMGLVFRSNLEAPAQCALEISQALKSPPNIQLRMGIHSGPVNAITDLNEQAKPGHMGKSRSGNNGQHGSQSDASPPPTPTPKPTAIPDVSPSPSVGAGT